MSKGRKKDQERINRYLISVNTSSSSYAKIAVQNTFPIKKKKKTPHFVYKEEQVFHKKGENQNNKKQHYLPAHVHFHLQKHPNHILTKPFLNPLLDSCLFALCTTKQIKMLPYTDYCFLLPPMSALGRTKSTQIWEYLKYVY